MVQLLSEDEVRFLARQTLFDGCDDNAHFDIDFGTGQITKFNKLGFPGVLQAPDGWYLPHDERRAAVVFEFKDECVTFGDKHRKQLFENMVIVASRYRRVCGVLWNGRSIEVYAMDGDERWQLEDEQTLCPVGHYVDIFNRSQYDSDYIQTLTMRINNALHFDVGMMNLKHRMLFTACALVALGYDRDAFVKRNMQGDYVVLENLDYGFLKRRIKTKLEERIDLDLGSSTTLASDRKYLKVRDLVDIFEHEIKANNENLSTDVLNNLFDAIAKIADLVSDKNWRGDDVMAIFFNEFTRYKGKSEAGQVFTPDHICDFMCRLMEVNCHDRVLDACCGSGTFLTKAMRHMVADAGGWDAPAAKRAISDGLYGIEFDREVYALACANMLMHRDGKSNLRQMDARDPSRISSSQRRATAGVHNDAGYWIRSLGITKVLMNPPYERKYHCMAIVENVLDSVSGYDEESHTSARQVDCAFIMPDKKLEKESKRTVARILSKHRLVKVLKLPDIFFGVGVSTSIFVFKAGIVQGDKRFWACDLGDDGFEVVKNKGRKNVRGKWADIEKEWLDVCECTPEGGEHNGQWHTIDECMSYQEPEKPFEIYEEDFRKTALDFLLFQMREREWRVER